MVDPWQVDLTRHGFRGMTDFQAGYEAKLDGLARERERPSDDSLAGNDGCNRGEDYHRDECPTRVQAIERVFECLRSCKQQGALAEIVDEQRRLHEKEPCRLDGLASEMSEIRVEGLGTSNGQEDEAHNDQSDKSMGQNKLDAVEGIECQEDARIICEVHQTTNGQNHEPDEHDGPKELRDSSGATSLNGKQKHEDN